MKSGTCQKSLIFTLMGQNDVLLSYWKNKAQTRGSWSIFLLRLRFNVTYVKNENNHKTHKFCDCLLSFITSKQIELESPGWSQIVALEKSFPDLMWFLKIDTERAEQLSSQVVSLNSFYNSTTTHNLNFSNEIWNLSEVKNTHSDGPKWLFIIILEKFSRYPGVWIMISSKSAVYWHTPYP